MRESNESILAQCLIIIRHARNTEMFKDGFLNSQADAVLNWADGLTVNTEAMEDEQPLEVNNE